MAGNKIDRNYAIEIVEVRRRSKATFRWCSVANGEYQQSRGKTKVKNIVALANKRARNY